MADFINDITVTITKATPAGSTGSAEDNETTSELGKAVLGTMTLGE